MPCSVSTRSCAAASACACATVLSAAEDSVVIASRKAPRREDSERPSEGWPMALL
ncbi:hypothetical protein [Teichococcus coralli]|uniref:hypothetical protein n=1 Tax=Teichococcus coralli TaxID=2545983 RepID=UPI001F3D30A5|nr:hypothetical protein [Pseudoroseomonas coralli]